MTRLASFEPLRVTAALRTAVVSDEYLPLDGILFYQAMRERYGARDQSLPGGGVDLVQRQSVSMPLELRRAQTDESIWWYACSFACTRAGLPQWWRAEGQDHWNKRFDNQLSDLVDFGKRRGKVIIEKGQYRAYHMPVVYRVATEVSWHCVGDLSRIRALLATVTHIGKKQAQGWGRVAAWTVEPVDADWSCWRDGQPTRALPVAELAPPGQSFGVDRKIRYYGVRPSYYDRRNQMSVIVP